MPIIYSLVSYKSTIQAESTASGLTGNFAEVAKLLVKKLPANNSKLSYIYDDCMFHYIVEHQWIYLCICDIKYQRMLAFQFLSELGAFVKSQLSILEEKYMSSARQVECIAQSPESATPVTPLQHFLNRQMDKYNNIVTDKHHKLYSDISDLKDTLIENIDKVLERGERIDLLVDKSESLNEMSFVFKKNAKKLKEEMWWKNTKILMMLGGIGLFVLYLIVSSYCGATLSEC